MRHAATFVDTLIFARDERDLLHHLTNVPGNLHVGLRPHGPGFLLRDGHRLLQRVEVVRADFRANAVLKRCDDFAASSVVLGVCREGKRNVKLQTHRVTLNLHVTLLHDVEERDLNFSSKIRHLIHSEDATVGARQQAVVHGQLA